MKIKTVKSAMKYVLSLVMLLSLTTEAFACTGIYVGPEVSTDGTTIIARSNDNQAVWPNYVDIVERVENKPGRELPVDSGGTVFAPLPDTTYKYTATPWMDMVKEHNGLERDGAACANEYGVSMTMSVTAFANAKALKADPLTEKGLTEFTASELVICQSKTAREAVEVLFSLIDTYGSSECNIAMISDQTEVWYIEMYTGHQYAAVKMPKDKVSVFGNEFNLVYLSDYEDSIVSKDLEATAKNSGFAVYGENGELNLFATYSMDYFDYSHMRTWIGHKTLAPSGYGAYEKTSVYPLVFAPEGKVAITDVFNLMRNRFEGTEFSPDDTGRTDIRVIGTDTALSVHAIQTYPNLPADMSVVTWESSGPAAYGVFVPVSNFCNAVSEAYGTNQPGSDFGSFDTDKYAYYLFKGINTLCVFSAEAYGRPVQEYWKTAEAKMANGMSEVLKTAAENRDGSDKAAMDYVTNYCISMQETAFNDGKSIYNDINWLMAENSNTMRKGTNPETHEVLDEDKPLTVLEVKADASGYDLVPEYTNSSSMSPCIIIAVAVVVAAAAVFVVIKLRKKSK